MKTIVKTVNDHTLPLFFLDGALKNSANAI